MKKSILIFLSILLASAAIVFFYLYYQDSKTVNYILEANTISNLDSTYTLQEEIKDSSSDFTPGDSLTSKQNALLYSEKTKIGNNYNYYIIIGSFSNKENAEKQKVRVNNKGYTSKIIRSDFDHYKVSIFSSLNKQEALDSLNKIKLLDEFKEAWLLKRKI